MKQTLDVMKAHRSIRKFQDREINDEVLTTILEASRWASTSSNFQAYSVIIIRDQQTKKILSELSGGQKHVLEAPVFLVFVSDLYKLNLILKQKGIEGKLNNVESYTVSVVDTALVAQNVMLAAESLGLGGVFVGGIRNNPEKVHQVLELPKHVFPVFGMCLGYPDPENIPEQKPRLPIDAYVHYEKYKKEGMEDLIKEYDSIMEKYYNSRSTNNRNDTWSDYIARLHVQKSRDYLKEYLEDKGFGFE